jgi:hypothetical protein
MFECQQSPMASNWSRSLHAIIKMVRDVFLVCIQINRCHQFCLPLHSFKILKQTQKQREAGHWDSDIKISRSAHDQPVSTSMAALRLCWNQRQQRWWGCSRCWRWRLGRGCVHFWVCAWSLGDMIGGWLSSHGCNWEIAFWGSEHGGEPLFFVLLLLAWQIQKRKWLM